MSLIRAFWLNLGTPLWELGRVSSTGVDRREGSGFMLLRSARRGPENAGILNVLLVFVLLVFALVLVAAGCSNPPERVPVAQADPSETATAEQETVAAQPPTVVPTALPVIEDQLASAAIASLTTLQAGEQAVDESGNLITIHGLRRLPGSLGALRDQDLFADTEALVASTQELVLLDIAMCAAGEFSQEQSGSVEFLAAANAGELLDEAANLFTTHALAAPGFVFPAPGSCSRGWVPVDLAAPLAGGATDPVGRYVLTVDSVAGPGLETHVYQWPVASADSEAETDSPADAGFERGQIVTFNEGPLVGTTINFQGWAELIDAPAPLGNRLVGALLEICPATEDWPELGVSVEGWNLFGPADPADRLGADPLAAMSGSCFEDWAEFAVPLGAAPTGFFVSDGVDPVNGFAHWTFEGAAIQGPT